MVVVRSCRERLGKVTKREKKLKNVKSIKLGTHERLPVTKRRKVEMKSNHHAPYGLGYTRTTMATTKSSDTVM